MLQRVRILFLLTGWCLALGSREEAAQGPVFLQEPPHRADFSNSSGVAIHCAAHGKPPPRISWLVSDGSEAAEVAGLRQVLENGTLLLPPFPADRYRPDVHSAAYRCAARNSVGTIVSRRVQVRAAVEKQHYEVQVYDEFVMSGNTAVLRCHVPSLVRDHVIVTSWLRGNAERIVTNIQSGGRYSVFPTGELHIRAVTPADGELPYRCETTHLLTGKSRLSTSAARLLVTSPQSSVPPRITDSRSHVQARHRLPAELPCAAQGFPLPTYTWFRSQGSSSQPVVLEDRVRQVGGSLFLDGALPTDSGRYVCVVNNSVGAERASTSLLVTTPLSAHVSPQQQTVDAGRAAQLNCSTEGHPQLAVSWLKDGRPLHASARVRMLNPQTLRIEHVEQHDAGMYQCVVTNNDEAAQGTAQISLGDAAPVLVRTFSAATLPPGSPWSAECEAAGSPLPSVSWRRDGQPIASSQQHTLQVSVQAGSASVRGRLSLSAVRAEDGGWYECVAASAAGSAAHGAALRVLGPPHVRPMPDRRVVAHTDAAFHCRVTGHPISHIRWQKDGTTLPDNDRQQVFENGTLIIKNMQKHSDEGGYVCVATNPDGLTSRSKLNIQVMEPPEIDPISTKPDLQRGMRTHLSCIVSKGDLPIEIRWLKDGAPVPEDEEVSEKTIDDYSSTLSFRRLAPRHAGNYSCHAANAAATAHYTVQVTVNEPPSWKQQPRDTQVEAGRSVTLACSADGSPAPRIIWKKDSGSTPSNFQDVGLLMANYKILDNGSLWIHSARALDKGHYLCQAANGVGIGLSKVVYLDVRVPARFHRPFQNITAVKGSSASLDCTVDGDKPVIIEWFQNGQRFDASRHGRVTVQETATPTGLTSKLEFKRLERADTTHFVCVASNKYGTDKSEILLVVQEPPDAPVNFHVSNYSSRSVSLSWEQPYDGNSRITQYVVQYKNASVTWHWNVAQVLVQGSQQSATVSGLLPARVYQFRALASNAVGRSNATKALSVTTMEEPPEAPPRDVRARTKSSDSIFVTWKPPDEKFQNGEILGYYIGYRKTNSSDAFHYKTFEVIPGMPLQGLLANLQKFTEYTILIQAYNKAGAGPKSPEVSAMTDEDVPGAPPEDVKCKPLSPRSMFVQWSPPSTQINGILQGFKVLYRALSDWEEPSVAEERVTQDEGVELVELQSFCNYSLEVRAFTRKGDGVPSPPVFCRTLEDVPGEPADIKALVMDSQTILISWRPPKYPNGRLTKYTVYIRSIDGFGLTRDRFDIPPGQTWYRVSHLAEQRRYEVWVSAATAAGEGAASRRAQQAPAGRAPARVASFSRQVAAPPRQQLSLPCLAVGQPPPQRRWTKDGVAVETSSRVRINEEWQLSISPTRSSDSGEYSCEAENTFGSDRVVYSVTVREAWNSGVPAAPVDLRATPAGYDSILLQWRLPEEARRSVQGYYLHFKKEFGEWEEVRVPGGERNWTVSGLQCGTRYQLNLQPFNQEGRGAATPTTAVRTLGTAPVAPTDSKLIRVNSTSISLNLRAWQDGGCAITSVVVEYKARREPAWTLVSNNAQVAAPSGGGGELPVLDLAAGTAYLLRVTAHNSAGSTVATYAFATLTQAGATVSPELMVHSEYSNRDHYAGVNIIVPIASGVSFLVILAVGLLLYLRRISGRISQDKYEDKPAEVSPPLELEGKGATQTRLSVEEGPAPTAAVAAASTAASAAASTGASTSAAAGGQPQYMPAISLRDVSPYATFRVPLATTQGCPDVVQESVYHSGYSGGAPSPRTVTSQTSAMEVTCRNIQETRRYSDKTEWVPLRNLYLTHRY